MSNYFSRLVSFCLSKQTSLTTKKKLSENESLRRFKRKSSRTDLSARKREEKEKQFSGSQHKQPSNLLFER